MSLRQILHYFFPQVYTVCHILSISFLVTLFKLVSYTYTIF